MMKISQEIKVYYILLLVVFLIWTYSQFNITIKICINQVKMYKITR